YCKLVDTLSRLEPVLQRTSAMEPEDMQILFDTAQWIMSSKRNVLSKVRQLAGTEENYLLLVRELDRVTAQMVRARTLHAEATLTLVDWLVTLNRFHWQCAYCQERAFQVMINHIPLPEGG